MTGMIASAGNASGSSARGREAKSPRIACAPLNHRNLNCVSLITFHHSLFFTVSPPLEHFMDSLAEAQRNLRPSPPKHPENDLEDRECEKHVGRIQQMPDKEGDRGDREDRE